MPSPSEEPHAGNRGGTPYSLPRGWAGFQTLDVGEQRELMVTLEKLAASGRGCSNHELVFLLDRCCNLQQELIKLYRSEEWALSRVEQRIHRGPKKRERG